MLGRSLASKKGEKLTLLEAFKQWQNSADDLADAVMEYTFCLQKIARQELKEQVLNEQLSEEEKKALFEEAKKLEKKIHSLYNNFLNHARIVTRILEREMIVDFNIINKLNDIHVDIMQSYRYVEVQLESLAKNYPDYDGDFYVLVDFPKMEAQRKSLDVAIAKFNMRFCTDLGACLYSTKEARAEAFQQGCEGERKHKD